jgi:hypothetical protein
VEHKLVSGTPESATLTTWCLSIVEKTMTLEVYLDSLVRTINELPALIKDWDSLDSELKDNYREQIEWLLRQEPHFVSVAKEQNKAVVILLLAYIHLYKNALVSVVG